MKTYFEQKALDEKKKKEEAKNKGTINYCKPGMMSTCTCPMVGKEPKWSDHIGCKFAIKSSFSNRCMHYVQKEFCDCMEAQKDAKNKPTNMLIIGNITHN